MRLRVSRVFFVLNISLACFGFKRLTRAQVCIDGTAGCFAWPRSRGQPPKPGGSRRKARGVDGESARQATMMPGHYAANVSAFCVAVDPLSPLKCGLRLVNRYPRRSPSSLCGNATAASTYSGRDRVPYQGPTCIVARAQGSKGDGTHLLRGVLQPGDEPITHPPWKRYILFALFAAFLFALENRAFRYDAGLEIAPKRDQ